MGLASKPVDEPEPPTAPIPPEESLEIKPTLTPRPREQALLLQAIQELDLTTAELEEAHEYIQKLERTTKRYNWFMDYWKDKEFTCLDGSWNPTP
jgi:hypothetical protein